MKWEYKIVTYDPIYLNAQELEIKLNIEGSLGWELITKDGKNFYFKRPEK